MLFEYYVRLSIAKPIVIMQVDVNQTQFKLLPLYK